MALPACSSNQASNEDDGTIWLDLHGSDAGNGTQAAPYRTLKHALAAAKPFDTIRIAAGDYTLGGGDVWGYSPPQHVTLRGDSRASTRLFGPAADGGDALHVSDSLQLEHLTLLGFNTALEQTEPGAFSLDDVSIESCNTGVLVTETAIGSELHLTGSSVSGGVFVAAPDSQLQLDASDISGDSASAAVNFAGSKLAISDSTLRAGSAPYGISLRAGALSLVDSSISGGNYGVYQLTGSSLLRRSRIEDYGSIGLYYASGSLDLGTATEAGDNAFVDRAGSTSAFALYVDTGTAPATSSNTSFDGVTPPDSVVQAGETEVAAPGEYFVTPGQRLTFFHVAEP